MYFRWHLLPDFDSRALKPQAILMMMAMAEVFKAHGYDCWFTSGFREEDKDSLHGYGLAVDCDASVELDNSTWAKMKTEVQRMLGKAYQIIVHTGRSGRMHMHGEYDPTRMGVAPYRDVV